MGTPVDTEILPPSGEPSKLPSLGSAVDSPDFLPKVKEILETMLGRRGGSNWDRVVTFRDLYGARGRDSFGIGQFDASSPTLGLSAQGYANLIGRVEAEVRKSAAFKTLTQKIGSVEDLAIFPDEIRTQLSMSIAALARERGADIQRVEQKIQSAVSSFASTLTEITAAIGGSAAGVRELDAAFTNMGQAIASSVKQVSARLDDVGGVTIEEKFIALASITDGLLGQWSLKIQAGSDAHPVIAGLSLSVEGPDADNLTSSLVFLANRFAFFTEIGNVAPFIADANGLTINGLLRVNGGGPRLQDIASGSQGPPGPPGATGGTGPTGARGNVDISVITAGTVWSNAEAAAGLLANGYGAPQARDVVTLYKANGTFAYTRAYTGTSWVDVVGIFNGNILVKGSVLADAIAAEAITAEKIAAKAITARSLAIGTPDNILPDPQFKDLRWWHRVGSGVGDWSAGGTGWKGGASLYVGPGNTDTATESFQMTPGAVYKVEVQTNLSPDWNGYAGLYLEIANVRWDDMGQDALYTWGDEPTTHIQYDPGSPKLRRTFTATVNVPDNTYTNRTSIRIRTQIAAGTFEFGSINITRVSDTTLIGDNGITTPKIAAEAVDADRIKALAVTAIKIATDAVQARHIGTDTLIARHIQADAIETDKIIANGISSLDRVYTSSYNFSSVRNFKLHLVVDQPGAYNAELGTFSGGWILEQYVDQGAGLFYYNTILETVAGGENTFVIELGANSNPTYPYYRIRAKPGTEAFTATLWKVFK